MSQPQPLEIAERLLELHASTAPRKKIKGLRITKAQFNVLAGRQKIEDSILIPIIRKLRREKLHLVRIGDIFAILDEGTVGRWDAPDQKMVRQISKPRRPSPQAAWPFSIGKKS